MKKIFLFSYLIWLCWGCSSAPVENRKEPAPEVVPESGEVEVSAGAKNRVFSLVTQQGLIRNAETYRNNFLISRIKVTNQTNKMKKLKMCTLGFFEGGARYHQAQLEEMGLIREINSAFRTLMEMDLEGLARVNPYYRAKFINVLELQPGDSIMLMNQYFDLYTPGVLNQFRVECEFEDQSKFSQRGEIRVYQQRNEFQFPMKGEVAIIGHPYEIWGHRLSPYNEFGMDLILLDKFQKPYSRVPISLTDHYCYGKSVLAPAAGKVAQAFDGLQDNPVPYQRKAIQKHLELAAKNFNPLHRKAGNLIVLDHGSGEFSFLGHLRRGTVLVHRGDEVKAGQVIAQCGNSGEGSTFPHLHFQLMEGEDPVTATSLPVNFSNTEGTIFNASILKLMDVPEGFEPILKGMGTILLRSKAER